MFIASVRYAHKHKANPISNDHMDCPTFILDLKPGIGLKPGIAPISIEQAPGLC